MFESYKGDDKIWGVILCAALKAVGESSEIPIDYYDVNVGGLVNLLKVMRDNDCQRLVYSSSATVYGVPPKVPIPESTRLAPESVYGEPSGSARSSSVMFATLTPNSVPSVAILQPRWCPQVWQDRRGSPWQAWKPPSLARPDGCRQVPRGRPQGLW